MSAISGIINFKEATVVAPNLRGMSNQLSSHGPDGDIYFGRTEEGYLILLGDENDDPIIQWAKEKYDADFLRSNMHRHFNFLFNYRFLNLSGARQYGLQPLWDQANRVSVLFAGEIYNNDQLIENLNLNRTDDWQTEQLIMKGYLEEGKAFFRRLNGGFAIALYDGRKGETLLVRDRSGIKSLFYYYDQQRLVFGSNIRAILKSGLYNKAVDLNGFYNAISFPGPPQPLTVFKDITALRRARILIIRNDGRLEEEDFWEIPIGMQDRNMKLSEASEALDEVFQKAVKRQTANSENEGTLISGGVDSPYLSAHASQWHPHIKAFTIGLEHDRFSKMNEIDKAALTAKKYSMEHIIERFDYAQAVQHLDVMVENFEQPGASIAPYFLVCKVVKEHGIQVLLNGLAADEQHGGFAYFMYLPIWRMLSLVRPLFDFIPRGKNKNWENFRNMFNAVTLDEYYAQSFSAIKEHEKKQLFPGLKGFDSYHTIHDLYNADDKQFSNDIEAMMFFMFANVHNHHLYRFEQFAMHFSVEPRYPFLDNDFIDVSWKIPSRLKVRGDNRKVVLKKAASKYIAPESLVKQKKGLSMPIAYWLNHEMKDFANKRLDNLKNREFSDAQAIDRFYYQYKDVSGGRVWKLVMVELWLEKFIDHDFDKYKIEV